MIGLAQKHVPVNMRRSLAQVSPRQSRIVVTDVRGRGISNAEVSVWSGGREIASDTTDPHGDALFTLATAPSDVRVIFGSQRYTFWSKIPTENIGRGGDVFIQIPVCYSQPLLTTAEGLTLLAGVLVAGAGFYWQVEPAKVTGEVLLGAAIFTAIYRISCL